MARTIHSLVLFLALAWLIPTGPARAADDSLQARIDALGTGGFADTAKQIQALAATGDDRVVPALEALLAGGLYVRQSDKKVFITKKAEGGFALIDPLTGRTAGTADTFAVKKIRVNNRLRRELKAALGGLTLLSKDPAVRLKAAAAVFKSQDPDALSALDAAILKETDDRVREAMRQARAAVQLKSDVPEADKVAALKVIEERGDRDALSVALAAAAQTEGAVKAAAEATAKSIRQTLELWSAAQNVWYGLSLGSVLLLAAIGLAITFGVMGVINMAHGEMVMIGAYVTFMVQEVIRTSLPGLFDYSLLIAVPLAFLVAGAVGMAIERGIIRFLYGRPLETLLATWGLSLVLQQTVRTIFGPTNREVGAPEFMSGAFEVGHLTVTYNRLWIIVFALAVLFALMAVLKKTPLGLQMRAVTQNRRMAGAMGIRTSWVDAVTFGLGSGIAGIAGVALSQIDNVSPNLGQSYIIDSFMVVVFGGVGNLWGTLVGAMTLGVANKFLEPYAGAVLGKVLVLVFIILFIQKRPRGLFALKGRAIET
ncbi:MAG: urea ABC transporter permease subunit UrtB [Rhodospirillales bacterium CG15_BIG_FIL_POST_REV_8_21_14_020_66_15]|nr:MAG: urea ABC transporter permease subunit UrtB [Rhodospirillales bacterium CG15_BIG_FIL_POST_REV_8_21_14_020_66_15]